MKKFFQKLFQPKIERKYSAFSQGYESLYQTRRLTPFRALEYYNTVAPVHTAINMIATEVSSLYFIEFNIRTDEQNVESDLLSLLKFPNADCSQYEFMTQLTSFYKLTGNAFIIATGPVHKPAVELHIVNPMNIIMNTDDSGELVSVQVMSNGKIDQTFLKEEVDGRYRYYSGDAELWHIKSFNSRYAAGDTLGTSDLSPILIEIEQYQEASYHNLSLLKRGARPSGAIKVDEMLTDEQFQRLQHQLENFYSGSHNAGRAMILEGGDFVEMSQTNKDMDFANLKKEITSTIYNALKIPLPMVNAEFSSYNNMETAKLNFYDNAVLPTAKRLLEELTIFLMHRYDNLGIIELRYDLETIEALEPRRNQELLKLKDSGVLTINELRSQLGYEELDGGDTLFISSTLMPIDSNLSIEDLAKNIDEVVKLNTKACKHK